MSMRLVLFLGVLCFVGLGVVKVSLGAQEDAAVPPTIEVYKSPT